MNELKDNTSKRIKELRLKKGLTMEQLAEKLNVSKSAIAKWENGYVDNMRQDKIQQLADLFNVSPVYILGYGDSTIELTEIVKGLTQDNLSRLTVYAQALLDSQTQN